MPGKCPLCGGRILKRTGKSKKTGKQYTFYCCEHRSARDESKKCEFITWDVPVKDNCPVCGQTMFKTAGKGAHKPFCINEQCANFTPEEKRGGYRRRSAEGDAAEEKTPGKKTAAKKTAAKKTTARKTATKKTTTKKTAAKKTAAKK
jgi:DNA topoisomerase-1